MFKAIYAVRFHYDNVEKQNYTDKKQGGEVRGRGRWLERKGRVQKSTREPCGVTEVFYRLIVVVVTRLNIFVKIYQITYLKRVDFPEHKSPSPETNTLKMQTPLPPTSPLGRISRHALPGAVSGFQCTCALYTSQPPPLCLFFVITLLPIHRLESSYLSFRLTALTSQRGLFSPLQLKFGILFYLFFLPR